MLPDLEVTVRLKQLALASLVLALLACASIRNPVPARTWVGASPQEAFSVAMEAMTSLDYRVTTAEKDAGLLVGIYERGPNRRLTVTITEQSDGASLRIAPESELGADDAEEHARQFRREVDRLDEDGQ